MSALELFVFRMHGINVEYVFNCIVTGSPGVGSIEESHPELMAKHDDYIPVENFSSPSYGILCAPA